MGGVDDGSDDVAVSAEELTAKEVRGGIVSESSIPVLAVLAVIRKRLRIQPRSGALLPLCVRSY